jgi:hypothetical protein
MRKLRKTLIIFILTAGTALCVCLFRPHEPSLLDRATKIADFSGWGAGEKSGYNSRAQYFNSVGIHWLSDHEVLFDRFEGPKQKQVIYKRDIRSAKETRLEDLTRNRERFATDQVDCQCVSPDGKWFICSDRWGNCHLAAVNGPSHYIYKTGNRDCDREVVWLADNTHWLENLHVYSTSRRLLLHDTRNPAVTEEVALGHNAELFGCLRIVRNRYDAIATKFDTYDIPGGRARLVITKLSLETGTNPHVIGTIEVPWIDDDRGYDIEYSRESGRIAWQRTTIHERLSAKWLSRVLRFIRPAWDYKYELRLYDMDGKYPRYLGCLTDTTSKDWQPDEYINIKWVPGGKSISFEYRGALYVIPAH